MKKKYFFVLLYLQVILSSCNSGLQEQDKAKFKQDLSAWNQEKESLQNLETHISQSQSFFESLLTDSLGEQGLKFLEKDSLSNEMIKSIKNDYENLKTDYANLMANYNTLIKETEDWMKKLNENKQSSDELKEEWESKQRQIQEILSQKEAYEQAFSAIKSNYVQAIIEIKKKMNKK